MKFDCKEISINDGEMGCTLKFSEKEEDGYAQSNMTFEEIINSSGQYLLLQRTYSEDDFESDYFYIETKSDDIFGELKNFEICLSRKKFELKLEKKQIEISISPTEKEFADLKETLPRLINETGKLIVNE